MIRRKMLERLSTAPGTGRMSPPTLRDRLRRDGIDCIAIVPRPPDRGVLGALRPWLRSLGIAALFA
jgi:hypothetical protein